MKKRGSHVEYTGNNNIIINTIMRKNSRVLFLALTLKRYKILQHSRTHDSIGKGS